MDDAFTRALTGSSTAPALTFQRVYTATAEELRSAFVDPDRLSRWLGTLEGQPRQAGDPYALSLGAPDQTATGTVLACAEDEIVVSWSWPGERGSTVSVRFDVVDQTRTRLTLRHELAESDKASDYSTGWEEVMTSLAHSLDASVARMSDEGRAETASWWAKLGSAPLLQEHRITAPIAQVWTAWTTSAGLAPWWWRHWDDTEIEVDFRVGGQMRFVVNSMNIQLICTILAIDPGTSFAATWHWNQVGEAVPDEAFEIRLREDGDATVVTIVHTGPWDNTTPADRYGQGWNFVFSELEAVIGAEAES